MVLAVLKTLALAHTAIGDGTRLCSGAFQAHCYSFTRQASSTSMARVWYGRTCNLKINDLRRSRFNLHILRAF